MKQRRKKQDRRGGRPEKSAASRQPRAYEESAESRRAVAATVAWMLALMATVIAESSGFACQLYTVLVQDVPLATVLATVLLLVACLAGLVTLALTPVVLKVSSQRPPTSIVRFALLAGSLPVVALLLQQVWT